MSTGPSSSLSVDAILAEGDLSPPGNDASFDMDLEDILAEEDDPTLPPFDEDGEETLDDSRVDDGPPLEADDGANSSVGPANVSVASSAKQGETDEPAYDLPRDAVSGGAFFSRTAAVPATH